MSTPPLRYLKSLPVALVIAALLGGGVAATVTALIDGGSGGGATTTKIVQVPASDVVTNHHTVGERMLTPAEIYRRYAPGVVYVKAQIVSATDNPFDVFGNRRSEATGSGFVVDAAGDILTNNHVIEGARRVTVQFADHKTVKAKVVGRDPSTDLALLRVKPAGLNLQVLSLGSSRDVKVGDPTIAIGNPFGLDRTLTTGVVSAKQRQIQAPNGFKINDVIQTDAAINPGNSGGPLIDAAGRVIGVNSQIETGAGGGNVGIGFAVPIDTAKAILHTLKQGKPVQRAFLGVKAITVDHTLDGLHLPASHGALVQTVEPGSPADQAGVRGGALAAELQGDDIVLGGDVITRFDGRAVTNQDRLRDLVLAHKPGDKVRLELARKGGRKVVTVTLTKQPSAVPAG